MANVIKLEKPNRAAYNPDRPLEKNGLIQAQFEHFQHVEEKLPAELRTGLDVASIKTEGQAADYIGRVTQAIRESGGRKAREAGAEG
jgi:hypothetical protein